MLHQKLTVMKNLILLLIILLGVSCQVEKPTKQFFIESPEMDICNKVVEAYENQDWETYRSFYSDTAKLWYNENFDKHPGENIDNYIESIKDNLASMVYYRIEGDISEMIIDNAGDKWVYMWGFWVGKLTEETDEIETPFHLAYHIKDGKIVEEVGFWDNLPLYLEMQKLEILENKVPQD